MPKFGEVVEGKVVRIQKNREGRESGAILKLESGDTAFLPIKEISKDYVKKIEDHMKIGETIKVRVTGKNPRFNEFTVSLKKAQVDDEVYKEKIFQNKLKSFMDESRMKHAQIQRNKERKQSGRKRKDPKRK